MAKQILSAEGALAPQTQTSLQPSVRTENRGNFLQTLNLRWAETQNLRSSEVLFNWDDRTALMDEIDFVNQVRERLDETALKIAPSMLRIVLTVKAHIEDPAEQRAFLSHHVDWDFRRISELCITADSYRLLDPETRQHGESEIRRFGWSNALKLSYVRDPADREDIWRRACGGGEKASYRSVLEEMRRFRDRKLITPPAPEEELDTRLATVREGLKLLNELPGDLHDSANLKAALSQVGQVQKDLNMLKRVIKERLEARDTESLAESV